MAKRDVYHGSAIGPDGELRFGSVSQIELAGRCLRRWLYDKKFKIREAQAKSAQRGDELHEESEKYLKTGERGHLSAVLIRNLKHMPTPGSDLGVEVPMVPVLEEVVRDDAGNVVLDEDGNPKKRNISDLPNALLHAAGVPIVGYIDVLHTRPENYGFEYDKDARDEPGVIKIIDHKFVRDLKHAKPGPELVKTFQMAGYGKLVFNVAGTCERVRLTHNYFPITGNAWSPTAVVGRDPVERTWKQAEAVMVSMKHAAKEPLLDKVDFNLDDCESYGRLCPAADADLCAQHSVAPCSARHRRSLSARVGITATTRLLQIGIPKKNMTTPATNTAPGSLFDVIRQRNAAAATATAAPPQTVVAAQVATTVQSEIERLKAAESAPSAQAATAVVAPSPVAAKPALPFAPKTDIADDTGVISLVNEMISLAPQNEVGIPQLAGELARVVAKISGTTLTPGQALGGAGKLAGYTFKEVSDLGTIIGGQRALIAEATQAQVPTSPTTTATPAPEQPAAPAVVPPDAPTSLASATMAAPGSDSAQPEKRKRGRPPKAKAVDAPPLSPAVVAKEIAAQFQQLVVEPTPATAQPVVSAPAAAAPPVAAAPVVATQPVVVVSNPQVTEADQRMVTKPQSAALSFFVNVDVEGLETTPFLPILRELLDNMSVEAGVGEGKDFRLAQRDSKYSFGGWRGILTDALHTAAEHPEILPPAAYHLNGVHGEVMYEALSALRDIARRTGGMFVFGTR